MNAKDKPDTFASCSTVSLAFCSFLFTLPEQHMEFHFFSSTIECNIQILHTFWGYSMWNEKLRLADF